TQETGMDPIDHCTSRIKSEESMREKCRKYGVPETTESAIHEVHDGIGIRIVCAFLQDVYRIRDYLASFDDLEIVQEKDYIRNAKPNGYRSFHAILRTHDGFYVELQLRTISQDTWAALEHHMRYKKNVTASTTLIERELKRCADELASTDVSMQAIRDLIFDQN
ncbi:MAG: GTP pyrophosphokinase family protein, partial [Lachnospiraceae bacterium]|nr:GTP pyrophosphokinase family protein [Lachnospiraceae bacterium]